MKRDVTYLSEHHLVEVKASGSYYLSGELETLKQASRMLSEHSCKRCLFDVRASQVEASTLSAFQRPEIYRQVGIANTTRIAVVIESPSQEMKFYETVCRNRCWGVRLFDTYAAALAWLADYEEYPLYRRS